MKGLAGNSLNKDDEVQTSRGGGERAWRSLGSGAVGGHGRRDVEQKEARWKTPGCVLQPKTYSAGYEV